MTERKIINENSPLEEKMEAALKKANIKYKSQYTIHDAKDKWNAKYILDFLVYGEYCKIAVECDGNTYHGSLKAKEHDLKRDLWVKQIGIDDTLRFDTEQIKYNMDGIIKHIKNMIQAYDKVKYDKQKKSLFDINQIPTSVPKLDAEYIYKDLSKAIQHACNDTHKKVKINSRKKSHIVNAVRKSVFKAGFSDIHRTFVYFDVPQLETFKQKIDIFFGAYNIPCCIVVASNLKEVNIPKEIALDPSLLKIIVLYVTPSSSFEGKSFIILNGTSSNKSLVAHSDLVSYSKQDYDSNQYDKLLKEANKLEKKLRQVYKDLYSLNRYKKSLVTNPFSYLEKDTYEKLIISIRQFILSKDKYSNEEIETFDIAVEWIKKEGIYFKNVDFTMHDVALTIQYYRNKLIKGKNPL